MASPSIDFAELGLFFYKESCSVASEMWQFSLRSLAHPNVLVPCTYLLLLSCFFCWFCSITSDNYSQTDRWWSIVPALYSLIFPLNVYLRNGEWDPKLSLMAVLTVLWCVRLTFNFARKDGYNVKTEDYRWEVLRQYLTNPVVWHSFNIGFIAIYQNILLFLIVLPSYAVWLNPRFVPLDAVATFGFLLFLSLETTADQQQWNFQTEKYRLINNNLPRSGDYLRGFRTDGLFAYSRHPNFFSEMSIWWCYYLFSSSSGLLNATVIGTVLLSLLFQGSTWFTEYITREKYPDYKLYQQTTSKLMFWFPGPALTSPTKKSPSRRRRSPRRGASKKD